MQNHEGDAPGFRMMAERDGQPNEEECSVDPDFPIESAGGEDTGGEAEAGGP